MLLTEGVNDFFFRTSSELLARALLSALSNKGNHMPANQLCSATFVSTNLCFGWACSFLLPQRVPQLGAKCTIPTQPTAGSAGGGQHWSHPAELQLQYNKLT